MSTSKSSVVSTAVIGARRGCRSELGVRVQMRVREEFGLWFRALELSYERLTRRR